LDIEGARPRVRDRLDDAVVGRETADHHAPDQPAAEQRAERGLPRLPAPRVADAKRPVAVLPPDPLADHRRVLYLPERQLELRAPRVSDAVDGPDPAVLLEVRGVLGVPILRVHHEGSRVD